MPEGYLSPRRERLRQAQNPDGGWGYFPGKRSWLEPTAYALLALHGERESAHWQRGWQLLRSWQLPSGAWAPNATVTEPHWSTALAVSLHVITGRTDEVFHRGVAWLLSTAGAESGAFTRAISLIAPSPVGHDPKFRGWPWRPGTTAWVEPTAHSLVALKLAARHIADPELPRRVALGEEMLLRRRCADGGWNYGSRAALGITLPSYPETTALALLGLLGHADPGIPGALEHAAGLWRQARSRLSRAWLAIALRNFGLALEPESETAPLPNTDLMLNALELLAAPSGGYRLLRPGAFA